MIQNKKGGIQVDTIFIDEGFGTLDADSLNKAMQIINSLSLEGNKLVGIISHVDELKDQIDQKIEVYKKELQILMTGSRRHDILGKKENNLSNIRVLYRFENREELMHAEADQIVVTTTELLDVIWNHRSEKLYI